MTSRVLLALVALFAFASVANAQLPPPLGAMPEPPENPLSPEKSLLGKLLFWEEQLSSDNGVACATCHQPLAGGTDPRADLSISVHPGFDGTFGTEDDIVGAIGVVSADVNCDPVHPASPKQSPPIPVGTGDPSVGRRAL